MRHPPRAKSPCTDVTCSSLGAAGLALPIGAAGWWQQRVRSRQERSSYSPAVERALARARAAGKPLLVLLGSSHTGERGAIFGQFLNLASDEVMATLALCEVVCASFAALAQHVPVVPEGAPLMALVEPAGRVRFVDADGLPEVPFGMAGLREREYERSVRDCVRALGKRVIDAVVPDLATLHRRAADCRGVLSAADLARLASDHPLRLDPDLADRGAALLLLAADGASDRAQRVAHLAGIAARRLRTEPPAGARWAQSTGCGGFEEEGPDGVTDWGYSCGMSHTAEISVRFLRFYTGDCTG